MDRGTGHNFTACLDQPLYLCIGLIQLLAAVLTTNQTESFDRDSIIQIPNSYPDPETGESQLQATSPKEIADGRNMMRIYEPETEDSQSQASLPEVKIPNDDNSLVDLLSRKVPKELLIKIVKHGHLGTIGYAYGRHSKIYPVALTQVCRGWRTVVLGVPTLWANIRITRKYSTEQIKAIIHTYLERSKTCPLSLTWYWRWRTDDVDIIQVVLDHLIVPYAERIQRITVLIDDHGQINIGAFLAVIEPLDFPILRDVEIFCQGPSPLTYTLGRSAPLLRCCRFYSPYLLPPLPSNLVILDYSFTRESTTNIDSLLEFLPHVAQSLEHLRFRPPVSNIRFTPSRPKIKLQNLKSLLVERNHIVMDHILVPNLIYFAALRFFYEDAEVDNMFDGFSAPKLQSIRFYKTPLLPLLTQHQVSSMFPQLESVVLFRCTDESVFIRLLEPPEPEEPWPFGKPSENPFPKLKELAISDTENWTSLQVMIEKRFKNGDESLRKILLPHGWDVVPETDYSVRAAQWLPEQGIEHIEYEPIWALQTILPAPPEFQDNFWDGEMRHERLPGIFFSLGY